MVLLPDGSIRRVVVETLDRSLGWLIFGEYRPLSNICGDKLKDGTAGAGCRCMCKGLDKIEPDHCIKNAGKP